MKTVDIIERIEGEAKLNLHWENNRVSDAYIEFLNFRGFEYMLEGKAPLDALVYTPRMCGICGQAHLLATVNALENCYKNANIKLQVTEKAKILRELGLLIEIIQSHIKWFYFFIMPDINSASTAPRKEFEALKGEQWLKAQRASSEITKALALFGGQWPHTSYMIPGGVMCDPTHMDMILVENYIDQTMSYFEKEIVGMDMQNYLGLSNLNDLKLLKGDIKAFLDMSFEQSLEKIGQSYNRFFVISDACGFHKGKIKLKNVSKFEMNKIKEHDDFTFELNSEIQKKEKYGWAKTVKYDNHFYETGPLARAMTQNRRLVKQLHKAYEDSVLTRVMARVDEIAYLLQTAKSLLHTLDLSEKSYIAPKIALKEIDSTLGIGSIEATRGALKHEVVIHEGKIKSYDVVTPTVWNLGPGKKPDFGVAQKALIGLNSLQEATIVLRSFDVCSVCTTH